MRIVLIIFAVLALAGAVFVEIDAKSAIHEILAACAVMVFAICATGAAVLEHLDRLAREAKEQTIAIEEIARNTRAPAQQAERPTSYRIPGISS